MTRLALNLPSLVTSPLPLLRCEQVRDLTLSQIQIACLLANAFFCTFPRRNSTGFTSEYANFPGINFYTLFSPDQAPQFESDKDALSLSKCKANKLKCIFHYFKRVLSDQPAGCVTFRRQQLEQPYEWSLKDCTLTNLKIDNKGRIEDANENTLKVDFANKIIGGGVLSGGCVQEEIYFLLCPEMMISRLFVECLQPHEALVIIGAERFSNYSGYSDSFQWTGNYYDVTPIDSLARRKTYVTAIDALVVRKYSDQFRPYALRRELDKALAGLLQGDFDTDSCLAVATGNWGCGAFGGDKSLKSVIQLMSAAVTRRDILYFTFGDDKLGDRLIELHQQLLENRTTVAQLWTCLCNYNQLLKNKAINERVTPLFKYIIEQFSSHTP
ncbi:Poly(ADP-ribose) glycohydrolase-like [Oopsacas minuta]|uniref:poly(ADP-ribose) glycohydrolase n=1 Tax=Oopsacas minuta TaxID=111878 RepID=A0AAV7K8Y0_9METZ|nr:Poly(ADP-ribose) glycohydrolase-like [Oopsacas minuta]